MRIDNDILNKDLSTWFGVSYPLRTLAGASILLIDPLFNIIWDFLCVDELILVKFKAVLTQICNHLKFYIVLAATLNGGILTPSFRYPSAPNKRSRSTYTAFRVGLPRVLMGLSKSRARNKWQRS